MKLPFRLLVLPAVISVLTLQLSGCGEGGNDLFYVILISGIGVLILIHGILIGLLTR